MNDNVLAQSQNVESRSEPREVLNESELKCQLAEVLIKGPIFRRAVCRVNRQVHPDSDISLRPDAVVSYKTKLHLLCAASLLVYRL